MPRGEIVKPPEGLLGWVREHHPNPIVSLFGEPPKITTELVEAIKYFEPIAQAIHPKATVGFIRSKTFELAGAWLEIEMSEAQDLYCKERSIFDLA